LIKSFSIVLSKTSIAILLSIVIVAAVLSIYSYNYYASTSAKITDIAIGEIKSNAQIQVHDLSQILSNKFESVNNLLQTLADSPAIHNNEFNRAFTIINTREQYSNKTTDFYMWLDKNGKMNWLSNINQSAFKKYRGADLSYRPYFTVPKETHSGYFSSLIESNDNIPRLYISYPVINMTNKGTQGVFSGVVVASMRATTLGNLMQHQILPQFNSSVGLLDRNGIILYSSTASYIGKDYFGKEIQSSLSMLLSNNSKSQLNDLIKNSLQGKVGLSDIDSNGRSATISYEPVNVAGKYFLNIYIIAPHNFASNVGALIEQQRNFSSIIIIFIALMAFGIAFFILLWNKRLKSTVDKRTAELKTANEQLKKHDKMQKEFINIASHEIKTPTQALLSYSELLQRHPQKCPQISDAILRNAKRLQRLTNDILDVTKIESDTLNLNKEKFNLNDLLLTIIEDFKNDTQRESREVKIHYESKDNIILYSDKGRLTQVFSNIINNALKFSKKNGEKIYIDTKLENTKNANDKDNLGQVIISIKDDGEGIDKDILPRLFTKFASKSISGIGLGLFISKSIIESHGGEIWAENNKDGIGATFYVRIPFYSIK
jgi:signal transduction histidine kinase